jgi:hypothetical protein
MGMLEPFMALLAMIAFVIVAIILCHWLLEPVNRAAGHLNAPTRFQLTDFIWLMMQLQIVLAAVIQTVGEAASQRGLLIVLALLCLPVVVLWTASVSVVSRAGITQPLRRAAVILLLVPGALGELVGMPTLVVFGVMLFSSDAQWLWQHRWTDDLPSRVALVVVSTAALTAGAFALRWLSFWVLSPPAPAAAAGTQA